MYRGFVIQSFLDGAGLCQPTVPLFHIVGLIAHVTSYGSANSAVVEPDLYLFTFFPPVVMLQYVT